VVTGTAPPATSTAVTVTVTPDTTRPAFSYAICDATDPTLIKVFLSEPLRNDYPAGNTIEDPFGWLIETIPSSGPGDSAALVGPYTNGTTVILVYLMAPRDPNLGYKITTQQDRYDTAVTPNFMPAGTAVTANCIETEILPFT